jgi:hypothetical protein
MTRKLTVPTQNQAALSINFSLQFTAVPNIWVDIEIDMKELLDLIKTGLLNNQPVSKIQLIEITQLPLKVVFVYDIDAVKQGLPAWSMYAKETE